MDGGATPRGQGEHDSAAAMNRPDCPLGRVCPDGACEQPCPAPLPGWVVWSVPQDPTSFDPDADSGFVQVEYPA